jgi:hypothetical protein
MRISIISISLFFLSCSITIKQAEQEAEAQISDEIQNLEGEMDRKKADFHQLYQKASANTSDTSVKRMLADLEATVSGTVKFLDSMRWEMNRMDIMDVNNFERVRILFLYKGPGDTLLNKLKSSSTLAINSARTITTKSAIKSVSDSLLLEQDAMKWKAHYFEPTNSLAASMILYDLQTELLKMGKLSISDY